MTADNLLPLLTNEPHKTLAATSALLFHTRNNALELVTFHQVAEHRGAPALAPGHALTPEDELTVLRLLSSADTAPRGPATVFPPNLLTLDRHQIAWYEPPALRPMHFHDAKGRTSKRVQWPGLVMRVFQHRLYVVAVLGDQRPDSATKLYKAPCPNIWEGGGVCMGSAVIPSASMVEDIPAWNDAFFGSAFSHANDPRVVQRNNRPVDPMAFWQGESPSFEAKNAVSLRTTLGQWLAEPPADQRGTP